MRRFVKTAITALVMCLSLPSLAKENVAPTAEVKGIEININTAELDDLEKHLTGIGQTKAKRIIEYRKTHGAFTTIEQLKQVKGISQKIVELNRDVIRL